MAKRTIKVDSDFYIKLMQFLNPEERFISEMGGIVLMAPTGHNILIEFSPSEESNGPEVLHDGDSERKTGAVE
jgi:hypothetical protein